MVEWNENGRLAADVIHQFGSATSVPTSPHFSDQAEMLATHKWRRTLRDSKDIEHAAKRNYEPKNPH